MWKYIVAKWYSIVIELRVKRMRNLADSYSKLYNGKRVAVFPNVGLGVSIHTPEKLLFADKYYIYCNREGYLIARRRGMFDKKTNWTDALKGASYITY